MEATRGCTYPSADIGCVIQGAMSATVRPPLSGVQHEYGILATPGTNRTNLQTTGGKARSPEPAIPTLIRKEECGIVCEGVACASQSPKLSCGNKVYQG